MYHPTALTRRVEQFRFVLLLSFVQLTKTEKLVSRTTVLMEPLPLALTHPAAGYSTLIVLMLRSFLFPFSARTVASEVRQASPSAF